MKKKTTNEALNDVANEWAQDKGFADANDFNEKIAAGLNSKSPVDNTNAMSNVRLAVVELLPMMFNQIVMSNPNYGVLKGTIEPYYIGQKDVGNGYSVSDVLGTGPTSTEIITNDRSAFTPNADTITNSKPKVQEYQVNFFTPNSTPENLTLAPEGYAFYKELTINNIIYKQHWKEGAGVQFLARHAATLYDAMLLYKFDLIATRLFPKDVANWSQNPNCTYTTNAATTYECWVDILGKLEDFEMLSNEYNYNSEFKRLQASEKSQYKIFCSPKTLKTLKSGVLTQLYNTEYITTGFLEKLQVIKAKKLFVDTANDNIWSTKQEQYIADDELWVIHNDAFIDVQQTQESASQFFAKNFENFTNVYVVGAAKYVDTGKVLKIKAPNINNNI